MPRPTRKHQATHTHGHYFVMRFDAPTATQEMVKRTLGLDPRMVRFSVVRVEERLARLAGRVRGGREGVGEMW